ncbi:pancreatic lipase-related protein 2-like isoform X1 [Vespula maculifrons]|uniref:phospholipase A1 n=1 Tax=Vespula maculifrons TaxID=7453 RepID=A0ABD2CWY7_VESMC
MPKRQKKMHKNVKKSNSVTIAAKFRSDQILVTRRYHLYYFPIDRDKTTTICIKPEQRGGSLARIVEEGKKDHVGADNKTLKDLFNSTSCAKPPFECPHPQIEFYLYTRETQKDPLLLDVRSFESLYYSRFNKSHTTKIIIHGFGGGRNLAPSTDLRRAYFTRGDYNIIIVDYGTLVREPCLSQIQWGPDFCSRCIAQLVRYLRDHPRGTRPENIHVLGYSVGAHIAGLIANYLPDDKLGRITGLDPTIFFYMNGNRSMDLDETDAHFVDVIHTGAGILGQWGPNGHADFYVNGGSSQPGCATSSLLREKIILKNRKSPSVSRYILLFLIIRHTIPIGITSRIKVSPLRNALLRPHQSDPVLHRVDRNEERILGSTLRQSFLLPDRLVQSAVGEVHSHGRGHATYSTRHLLSVNKRTQTVRPRTSRKKAATDKSEAIVLPPVLSLLKQLINIIIE